MIFAAAVTSGIFICAASAIANAFLLKTGLPFAKLLMKIDAAGAIAAILLIWRLLRWSRERNDLARERAQIVARLNHEVRDAIGLITAKSEMPEHEQAADQIRASVKKIEMALDQYVPISAVDRDSKAS